MFGRTYPDHVVLHGVENGVADDGWTESVQQVFNHTCLGFYYFTRGCPHMFKFSNDFNNPRNHTLSSTLPAFPTALWNSSSANAGSTHSIKNLSTCSGARPTKLCGSRSSLSCPLIGSKYGSLRIRSMRSFSRPSSLT